MRVAIDGPAGVGKSTVAGRVAAELGFLNLNSGNLYRAVTLAALERGLDPEDASAVIALARQLDVGLSGDRVFVDGKDRTRDLHSDSVDSWVARHSALVPVRHEVNRRLRMVAEGRNVVMDGRDIGTVVLPDAEVKVFLDASVDARAERRHRQGTSNLSLEDVRRGLEERDAVDRSKEEGSLRVAEGAAYLDTSDLTIDEVCEKVLATIRERKKSTGSTMEVMTEKERKTTEPSAHPLQQDELQEQYLRTLDELEEGQVVDGTVVEVTSEQVFVDVGYKSEGKIPIQEFQTMPSIGDLVQVVLLKKENRAGEVIVSKQKADEKIFWKNLRAAFTDRKPVEGTISKLVKGGYEIDLGHGITGFNPISKIDVHRVTEPESLVGKPSSFYVERLYSENRVNIILSRRAWLEEAITRRKQDFFSHINVGDEVEGEVKSFTSFGAFIDLGGFDGLLHINDMSWGHAIRPKDFVRKGDRIHLKVIKIDPAEQKINLSLKDFSENPWSQFEEKYHIGDMFTGRVTKLADFGAFIELEEGIEGLAHISEFSWTRRVHHPKEMLKVGDDVNVMILGYDLEQHKLSLGIKQATPNPWDEIEHRYPAGMRLTRLVKKITASGAFVELEEGIDGFLHVDELSWTKKVKNPSSVLKEGEGIEVIVLDSNPDNRKIRLSVKQLSEDPWVSLKKAYPERSAIDGEITSITDFGIFVRVQGGIEGLINKTNISDKPAEELDRIIKDFKVGDQIRALVVELNPGKQKLSLSIKDLDRKQQREELRKYIHNEEAESTFTLGDFLKDKDNQ